MGGVMVKMSPGKAWVGIEAVAVVVTGLCLLALAVVLGQQQVVLQPVGLQRVLVK
jgi:hypothetical protein